jgi:hypothetical protein
MPFLVENTDGVAISVQPRISNIAPTLANRTIAAVGHKHIRVSLADFSACPAYGGFSRSPRSYFPAPQFHLQHTIYPGGILARGFARFCVMSLDKLHCSRLPTPAVSLTLHITGVMYGAAAFVLGILGRRKGNRAD